MAHLKIGDKNLPLPEGSTVLGRSVEDGILIHDRYVSGEHAMIRKTDDGWTIEDLRTVNKTYVNGRAISGPTPLSNGDVIRMGKTKLSFECEERIIFTAGTEENTELQTVSIDPANFLREEESISSIRSSMLGLHNEPDFRKSSAFTEARLKLLSLISKELGRILNPEELFNKIMELILKQTSADCGYLGLQSENEDGIYVAYHHGYQDDSNVKMSRGIVTQVLEQKTAFKASLRQDDVRDMTASIANLDADHLMCAPLLLDEEVIGVLTLESHGSPTGFSQEDEDLLLIVAQQAAICLDRSRLQNLEKKNSELRGVLQDYVDPNVAEQIVNSENPEAILAPKLQETTIMFGDIVSFTKASEGTPPQELAEFVRGFFTEISRIIRNHHGTIDKYIGDCVMALFGAPLPHEDSPGNAVRAALEIRAAVKSMKLPGSGDPVRITVGINSGECVVGDIGSDERRQYTAFGDVVNVAARLQSFARPDEICIDEGTRSHLKDDIMVEEIGNIDVRNRHKPVGIFKVLGYNEDSIE